MKNITCAVVFLSGVAFADKFDALSGAALRVEGPASLGALFWAGTVNCNSIGEDMERRECEGVRAARLEAVAKELYSTRADGAALTLGEWDKTKGGVAVSLRGCLACNAIEVDGERRYVVTKGGVSVASGSLRGPEIYNGLHKLPGEAAARRWKDTASARLETELVFKLPTKVDPWTNGAATGYNVELLGYRIYDPCDGSVVAANPPSERAGTDKVACKGGKSMVESEETDQPPDVAKVEVPKEPALPERLSPSQINAAMQKARTEVNACFATYGVPGTAKLAIEIGGDGLVRNVTQTGDFEDTPTGDCIIKAVKETVFPKFKTAIMTISGFPFTLR